MSNINGNVIKRTTLIAKTDTIVEFKSSQNVSVKADGGIVYFKVNGPISDLTDATANYISDGESFNIYFGGNITELHLYSDVAAKVQWYNM